MNKKNLVGIYTIIYSVPLLFYILAIGGLTLAKAPIDEYLLASLYMLPFIIGLVFSGGALFFKEWSRKGLIVCTFLLGAFSVIWPIYALFEKYRVGSPGFGFLLFFVFAFFYWSFFLLLRKKEVRELFS
ncbi:hypothetical protein HOC06_01340 [Candidatus Woesearchaeota archaeon]|jgi:hypothetical protein|nr:hypothetical protein [Candidatus Woesearchaeota archaeon]MBT4630849.1 hypothetical protein [Candidatus Woesearchaeota archaeon]